MCMIHTSLMCMDLFLSFSNILVFYFKFDDLNIPSNYIKLWVSKLVTPILRDFQIFDKNRTTY